MELLIKETPAKVMAFLGISLASMAFLFSVTMYDASFSGTAVAVADPFGPQNVMRSVDQVANSYSKAVYALVLDSVASDYALAADNIAWIGSNAKDGALAMLRMESSQPAAAGTAVAYAPAQGVVAGAYTDAPYQQQSAFSVDSLLAALGIQ